MPIERCAAREVVEIVGEITALESRAQESRVGLAATLSDATGSVVLLWMGRPSVSGIEVGRRMRVQGRLAQWHDRPAIYNPRYELLP